MLSRWCHERKKEWPFGKWVFEEDYHITLQFLGDCSHGQLESIVSALEAVAGKERPFTLTIRGIGTFGRLEQPRILWAGVAGDLERLRHLQQQVTTNLAPIGFPPEDRPYRPHITLARKYQKNDFITRQAGQMNPWETDESAWEAEEIVLYETRLGQQPMYHPISRFRFP
ncbi:2'-5' RNA ligase [Lihuaxuella thermophila]|uniref:RNA 2',3'-cyclic phosphodiesterase n=2 Tax=Lihuaxuella thermophila TaxID=1173111 RepID=A0A1H8C5X5_9BACL|nr:2'-5' RNA ligase [Lihuaxuella thermophila]